MADISKVKVTVRRVTDWRLVYDLARATSGLAPTGNEPTSDWKRKILACEHSPIRALQFVVRLDNLPSWVSVHLVRHKFGVEHFVQSQRSDRTGEDRDGKRQDAPVTHTMLANAQALISMSRRRLCKKASPETRSVWQMVRDAIRDIGEAELADAMVPECKYRGRCTEMRPCREAEEVAAAMVRDKLLSLVENYDALAERIDAETNALGIEMFLPYVWRHIADAEKTPGVSNDWLIWSRVEDRCVARLKELKGGER